MFCFIENKCIFRNYLHQVGFSKTSYINLFLVKKVYANGFI